LWWERASWVIPLTGIVLALMLNEAVRNLDEALELAGSRANLPSVRMVVFGYSAFTAGRFPVGTCVLQGTGFKQVLS